MNYIDLFSGIGGFHLGLLQAGLKFDWCGYSEIDKYAKQIYKKHFPESEDLGDVRTIKLDRFPERIDLITFGFPCQDLSIAGKRGGLSASRSGLFFEAMQIIGVTRPKYFIFENVKGLFSSNEGRDWITILREIANIGYDGQWQLLNTRWFLPQNRERVFFIGHIRGECRPEIFPIGESFKKSFKGNKMISNCLDTNYGKGDNRPNNKSGRTLIQIKYVEDSNQGQRVYDPEGISCSIKSIGGGQGAKTGLYFVERFPLKFMNRNQKNIEGDYVFTIDGVNTGGIKEDIGIRRLTPTECERLQGFPDGWTDVKISDTQRYKCLGNAVSIPVVQEIGKRLLKYV